MIIRQGGFPQILFPADYAEDVSRRLRRFLIFEFKVQSSKFKVQSSKFKVQSSKFKVQSSKFVVQSS